MLEQTKNCNIQRVFLLSREVLEQTKNCNIQRVFLLSREVLEQTKNCNIQRVFLSSREVLEQTKNCNIQRVFLSGKCSSKPLAGEQDLSQIETHKIANKLSSVQKDCTDDCIITT